jgi:ABC-2 type transport system ATP-binding protein
MGKKLDHPIILVENLQKKFGDLSAVNDVSFSVADGEVFGLLGPNGAGKTTTINILCTLTKSTSGRAVLNGFDVVTKQSQVRQCIGLVFQDPSLDERLTALENLEFHALVYNVPVSVRKRRIDDVLKMVELWKRRHDTVKTFSGGMKRRLEVARGLIHYPKVLFLDEPTLGLDPQTRNHLWEFIMDLHHKEGVTIFLTTHYMDEAGYADRIAIMDYGKIIALGSPKELKRLVGGDVIRLKTVDDDAAQAELLSRYHIESKRDGRQLTFEVPNEEEFVPTFIKEFNTDITNISMCQPTLEDVFLKLTGDQLRDETSGSGIKEIARQYGRYRMRR